MTIPLGDLVYDLIHAVALNDEVEILEAALALAKVSEKKIEDGSLEGSPSVALKLRRVRKRLKADLAGKGFAPTKSKKKRGARANPAGDDDDDDDDDDDAGDGLPTLDWTPDEPDEED